MKTLSLLILTVIAGAVMFVSAAAAQVTDWKQIPIPTLPTFRPKEPKRIELQNGMVIFLTEDHELPLIDGIARIRGGSREESANKAGLVQLYGETWRTGGTKNQTGDQLDDFLEARAARVETGGGTDSTTIGWSCLKEDLDDVFKVFLDVLRDPAFRPDKLDLAQKEAIDAISRRNDNPLQIAARQAAKLAYGADNPYVREPEYSSIAAVQQQDLMSWHKQHLYPNYIILGITGDFDSAQMEARLRQAFGSWAKGPAWRNPHIEFHPAQPAYYLVDKKDVNQSNIRMVGLGTTRDNPDYYAIEVFNYAFGGGFSSRLFQDIRTRRGLAYAVGGGIGTAFDHPGLLQMRLGTKSGTTVEALQALYQVIDDVQKHPIDEAEMKRAKDAILNSFIFNFDTPEKVLRERMAYEFYGYTADFLERYRAGVEKVTTADVARVAAKYLHKEQFPVLVVGNSSEFDKPLSALGPVVPVDTRIPPPSGGKKPAALERGNERKH